jgi:tRNA pseudouridine38-40 synthase
MARYQIILAYDGTHFLGFQRSGSTRTVQGVVEAALRKLGWQERILLSAGRTDTGVHASGQVIAFNLDWSHSTEDLGRAVNAMLPEDVAVKSIQEAAPDFHPRYQAVRRFYRYSIYCSPERDPLLDRFAWRVWPVVDEQRLHEAARILPGTHDFSAFGTPPRAGGSTVRTVYHAVWQPQAQGLLFEVSANAFLYHMVRRLVYWQVLTAQKRLSLEQWALAVEAAQQLTPGLAPPNGLVLTEVGYPGQEDK